MAFAIWPGAGTALVALVAWLFMGQKFDLPAIIGIMLIISGVLVLNIFSKSAAH